MKRYRTRKEQLIAEISKWEREALRRGEALARARHWDDLGKSGKTVVVLIDDDSVPEGQVIAERVDEVIERREEALHDAFAHIMRLRMELIED